MCQRDQHRMKSILEEKSEVTEKENAPNLDLKNGSVEFCNVCFGLICGRFEGIDQRVIDHYGVSGISVGDYVKQEPIKQLFKIALYFDFQ